MGILFILIALIGIYSILQTIALFGSMINGKVHSCEEVTEWDYFVGLVAAMIVIGLILFGWDFWIAWCARCI